MGLGFSASWPEALESMTGSGENVKVFSHLRKNWRNFSGMGKQFLLLCVKQGITIK